MLKFVQNILAQGKDSATALVFDRVVQPKISKLGRMLNFSIDSKQKKAQAQILLKGETDPVTLNVDRYQVLVEEGTTYVQLVQATASREWMDVLLKEYVLGKKFPVPERYAQMLRMVL